ncbi:MAG: hypothetical protein JNK77_15065 [Saprospiraceae bacterium]|nr:hypothetical protein [Saprospiraceae bacterium]
MKTKLAFLAIAICLALTLFGQKPNNLSPQEKIYGLSKFWQEVNYNFVFIDKINRQEWDALYQEMIAKVLATTNDYDYFRQLDFFCAYLKDGHTNIYHPNDIGQNIMTTMFGEYRLFLTNIDGKAIVTRVNESKKSEIPIGSEVIVVNGMDVKTYMKENVTPYIASSTDYIRDKQSVYHLLRGYEGDKFTIQLKKPNQEIITLNIEHQLTEEKGIYPPFVDLKLLDFKKMENGVNYLALNSFEDEKLDSLFQQVLPDLYDSKGLIIDLRNNGGGSTNIGFNVLKYLVPDSVLYGSKSSSRMHIPTYKAWGAFVSPADTLQDNPEWGMSKADMTQSFLMAHDIFYHEFPYQPEPIKGITKRIVVPTVILIGNATASAAEDFLIYAHGQKHFTLMGEKTFGSTGQPYLFSLPGGGNARVCTKKDTYPNGKEFVGYGITPDIEVKQSLDDYVHNRDVVLERALEHLKKQMKQGNNK